MWETSKYSEMKRNLILLDCYFDNSKCMGGGGGGGRGWSEMNRKQTMYKFVAFLVLCTISVYP